jgi:peptide/nickel transport system ATP-binding protein
MRQRVGIAMALACNPRLLIADEPTTALDVTIQAQVIELIRNLREEFSTAMMLITHDLGVVGEVCDRVAVMYAGEIVEEGGIEQIFEQPRHPYTVGLFKCIPDIEEDNSVIRPILGLMPDPFELPVGCCFHPRCPECMDICSKEKPVPREEDGHVVLCHLYREGGASR